jgi:hypothetical protein
MIFSTVKLRSKLLKYVFLESSSLASLQTDCYGELMLTIDKWHLDDAHKDKQNKIFDQNFKVSPLNPLSTKYKYSMVDLHFRFACSCFEYLI